MFNKKEWVMKSLKNGFDKGLWTAEHIMENAMKYSMAGVLVDSDLEELAAYTEPENEESEAESDVVEETAADSDVIEIYADSGEEN